MSGIMLDTDTCIELLRGNQGVVAQARSHAPADLAASVLTRYELLYGVERCQPHRREQESEKVLRLLGIIREAPFTASVAQRAAEIRAHLSAMGKPIGTIDVLIAATALEEGCMLITHNLREFSRVPGLHCLSWNT